MKKGDLTDLVLISSTKNNEFAKQISNYLGKPLAETERTPFRDSDMKLRIAESESVRGKHACLIMTYSPPISERLQELIIWIDALISGSAERITLVLPFFFGSRQDRKTLRGEPINFRAYINAFKGTAQEHLSRIGFMTADLHSTQLQGLAMYFDNLKALPLFSNHIKENHKGNIAIVAPDTGGLKKAEELARMVGTNTLACITKIRDNSGGLQNYGISGDNIHGKTAIIIDDMIDSGGTLVQACEVIRNAGAKEIAIYATHLLLNSPAQENLKKLNARVVGTDTVYHNAEKISDFGINRLPISYVFAEAIKRQHLGISTKELHTEEVVDVCFKETQTNI